MPYSSLHLDENLCFSLYSAANALVRAYRSLLDPLDITYPQYLVMMCLWKKDGVSVKALSQYTRLDCGTLTPLLKRLEAKELLLRRKSPHDERQKVITLTDKGMELRDQALEVPKQMAVDLSMSVDDVYQLKRLCEQMYANFAGDRADERI
jgi:DNA-binding MarR family transcriptional regulator